MDTGAVVDAWFAGQPDLAAERVGERGWFTILQGEHKRTIPVYLELGDEHLLVESFFMAAPDENDADIYGFLLRRNTRTYLLRFALSDEGEIMLVGLVPRAAVDAELLDRVLGQLLAAADDAFDPALRKGFATYIDREQRWRAKVGAPRNPVS